MTFATDVDLLQYEPNLFVEAAFASQTLLTAAADLDGTTLALSEGSLDDSRIEAGMVVAVSGGVNGSFPVVSITDATHCEISVMQSGLGYEPVRSAPVASAAGLTVSFRTFWPQRKVVSDLLSRLFDVEPAGTAVILNADVLRRPCVLGTLQMIYAALSAASGDDAAHFITRVELYERLYKRSLRNLVVEVDTDDDGFADCRRFAGAVRLVRQ
jgi:hypothetical protein